MLEDDGSSSDAGVSSHEDDFDRFSRSACHDDEDLDSKIKWFFQRIEEDERINPTTNPTTKDFIEDHQTLNNSYHSNSQIESTFITTLPDTEMHSTHDDSQTSSSDEKKGILGKRKSHKVHEDETIRRVKIDEDKEEIKENKKSDE